MKKPHLTAYEKRMRAGLREAIRILDDHEPCSDCGEEPGTHDATCIVMLLLDALKRPR